MKPARTYAVEIISEPDRENRRAMLEAVPESLRKLTREHVENYFALKNAKNKPAK